MPEKPQPTEAVEVFFSYAREDAELRKRLEQHFSFLRRERMISQWYDGEIKAWEEWRGEIEAHLNSADVILLLISAAFAGSEFCYSMEMKRAMERHNAGEAVVVPILLHPCDWHAAPFAKLQTLPGGGGAISEWVNVEKALYEVARGVREIVEELLARRAAERRGDLQPPQPEEILTDIPSPPATIISRQEPTQKVEEARRPRTGVFISYSHRDKRWLETLQTMLKPAIRKNLITVWDDTQIKVGSNWKERWLSRLTCAA
jgi:hypothetical protein